MRRINRRQYDGSHRTQDTHPGARARSALAAGLATAVVGGVALTISGVGADAAQAVGSSPVFSFLTPTHPAARHHPRAHRVAPTAKADPSAPAARHRTRGHRGAVRASASATASCIPATRDKKVLTEDFNGHSATVTLTGSRPLCVPLDVQGVAWTFDSPDSLYPQTLASAGPVVVITEPGSYFVSVSRICGQRDLYAAVGTPPRYPEHLIGPSSPYEASLLSVYASGPPTSTYKVPATCFPSPPATTPPATTPPATTPPATTPPATTPPATTPPVTTPPVTTPPATTPPATTPPVTTPPATTPPATTPPATTPPATTPPVTTPPVTTPPVTTPPVTTPPVTTPPASPTPSRSATVLPTRYTFTPVPSPRGTLRTTPARATPSRSRSATVLPTRYTRAPGSSSSGGSSVGPTSLPRTGGVDTGTGLAGLALLGLGGGTLLAARRRHR